MSFSLVISEICGMNWHWGQTKGSVEAKNNWFEFLVIRRRATPDAKINEIQFLTNPFRSITVCLLPICFVLHRNFLLQQAFMGSSNHYSQISSNHRLSFYSWAIHRTLIPYLCQAVIFSLEYLIHVKYTEFFLSFPNFPFTILTSHHCKNSKLSIFLRIMTRTEYTILGLSILF